MFNLLTTNNLKTNKSISLGYKTFILHLSPSTLAGVGNMCPKASIGCISGCLNTAGHGGIIKADGASKVQAARKRRTIEFVTNREDFMLELYVDIRKAVKQCNKLGLVPVIRLNGTSDIVYESIPVMGYANIFEAFPEVQFYDYTKIVGRYTKCQHIPNYELVFSRSEVNELGTIKAINKGMRVAVVFDKVPDTYMNAPVVDGDVHDLIFLQPSGSIIGLKAKGRARKDVSGFVVRTTEN